MPTDIGDMGGGVSFRIQRERSAPHCGQLVAVPLDSAEIGFWHMGQFVISIATDLSGDCFEVSAGCRKIKPFRANIVNSESSAHGSRTSSSALAPFKWMRSSWLKLLNFKIGFPLRRNSFENLSKGAVVVHHDDCPIGVAKGNCRNIRG